MSLSTIAADFVAKCRAGDLNGAMTAYYDSNIVSIEAAGDPREVTGLEACRQKGEHWTSSFETHGIVVNGPYVGTDQFAAELRFDVTQKATGRRFLMEEMALYTVRNEKVVKEQFFYHMPGM